MTENMNNTTFNYNRVINAHLVGNTKKELTYEFALCLNNMIFNAFDLIYNVGGKAKYQNNNVFIEIFKDKKINSIFDIQIKPYFDFDTINTYVVDNDEYYINGKLVKEMPVITYHIALDNAFSKKKLIVSISLCHGSFKIATWEYIDHILGKIGSINGYGEQYINYCDNFLDVIENIHSFFDKAIENLKEEAERINKDFNKLLRIKGD